MIIMMMMIMMTMMMMMMTMMISVLAMFSIVTPQPTLQHQPTRHRGTDTTWAREMIKLTSRQHSRSNVSALSPHLGPREEELQDKKPERRVPEPGQRQLRTRQTAADLWSRTGIAPRTMLSVL